MVHRRALEAMLIVLLFAPVPIFTGLPIRQRWLSDGWLGIPGTVWVATVYLALFMMLAGYCAWRAGKSG